MKQYTIYEPIKTVRVTVVNAPDDLSPESVYAHYNDGIMDIETVNSYTDDLEETVCGQFNIEENN
jgi:hypothetical protein